jgi:hypothetical protein
MCAVTLPSTSKNDQLERHLPRFTVLPMLPDVQRFLNQPVLAGDSAFNRAGKVDRSFQAGDVIEMDNIS